MPQNKLLQLAAKFAETMQRVQRKKERKVKRLLSKTKELQDRIAEFKEQKDVMSDLP